MHHHSSVTGKQNLIKITGDAKTTQSLTGKLIRKKESEIFISWMLWNHIGLKTFLWGSWMPYTYPNNEDLTSMFWVSTICHSLPLSSDIDVTMYKYMYRTLSRRPQIGLLFSVSSSEAHLPSRNTSTGGFMSKGTGLLFNKGSPMVKLGTRRGPQLPTVCHGSREVWFKRTLVPSVNEVVCELLFHQSQPQHSVVPPYPQRIHSKTPV